LSALPIRCGSRVIEASAQKTPAGIRAVMITAISGDGPRRSTVQAGFEHGELVSGAELRSLMTRKGPDA